jgi:hypothetical protein
MEEAAHWAASFASYLKLTGKSMFTDLKIPLGEILFLPYRIGAILAGL